MDNTRLYVAHFISNWVTDASVTYIIDLTEDGTVIEQFDITDGNRDICASAVFMDPTSGSHTYRIHVTQIVGGGNVQLIGTATAPRQFWIADIGLRA
jgi:hypothetical protein